MLCGVPIGIDACAADDAPVAYEEIGVSAVIAKHTNTVASIKRLNNPQAKFLIARYCIAARNGHLFRCVDPISSKQGALMHDAIVSDLLSSILMLPESLPGKYVKFSPSISKARGGEFWAKNTPPGRRREL